MAAALITSLAPIKLNSTVLATAGLGLSPDIAQTALRHSGNLYPSVLAVAGSAPQIRFRTPFWPAYSLIGIGNGPLKCTAFEVYFAKFIDATRQTGAVHPKLSLATSALGMSYITGASVDQNGILMADVTVMLLSNDGMTHPLARADTGTIPALGSEPLLHSLGPVTINGTTIAGSQSATMDMGVQIQALPTDGDIYPRVCGALGHGRKLSIGFADPATLLGSIGLLGANIASSTIQYFREYDATTQVKKTTGLSLTIASGRITPDSWTSDNLQVAQSGLTITPLSATTTDPFQFASGASIPTP